MSHNHRNALQKTKNQTAFKQTRKVQFKPITKNKKSLEFAVKQINDDDEDMDGVGTSSSFQRRRSRSPRPISKGNHPHPQKKLIQSFYGWYHVSITALNTEKADVNKDEVWTYIMGQLNHHIIPMHWKLEKTTIVFYVNDFTAAEKLLQLGSRKLCMLDNTRIIIRVRAGFPSVTLDEPYTEKMKLVMAKRYNAVNRSLDLSKFNEDPDFSAMFCGLFHAPILTEAIAIISQNIPDLEILLLNDNKISRIDNITFSSKLPNLKILNMANNRIQNIGILSMNFKDCQLLELTLKGNPFIEKLRNRYRNEVAKRFPTVKMLDGEMISAESKITTLPPAKASFFCQIDGTDIVRQFLEQYFQILDSSNRAPLADAYHEDALLSVTIPPAAQAGRIESIWKHNRNFLRVMADAETFRAKQLKVGRNSILGFLCDFPKTSHILQTFAVDMCLYTPKILSFNVAGLFKELDASGETRPIRYFHRQFIIVPSGGGFCIKNELLLVTSGHGPQLKEGARLII